MMFDSFADFCIFAELFLEYSDFILDTVDCG